MALYRNGGFEPDAWTFVDAGAAIPSDGPVLLSKSDFLSRRQDVILRNARVGVRLTPGEDLSGLEGDLERLALIALDFTKFSDGRLYSIARLLRERHGFQGELRACGDILRDQIAFLHRVGVDSFEIADEKLITALRDRKIVVVRRHYQRAEREAEEKRVVGSSFERLSPPGAIPGSAS